MPAEPASGAPRRVIIDTDPGIDDALALALALRSPELRVEAITTVSGNVNVDLGTRNTLLVLEALGVDNPPPVARGAGRPLRRNPVDASHVHGHDGVGGITALVEPGGSPRYAPPRAAADPRHAVDLILDLVRKHPDEITLIAVGPLTNVALAIERDPAAMARLAALIVMGGSLSGVGNVTPTAEFNFHVDPDAASQVLRAGLNTTLVGLDVTQKTLLHKADLDARLARSKEPQGTVTAFSQPNEWGGLAGGQGGEKTVTVPIRTRLVEDISAQYFAVAQARTGHAACPLHDPLAVGVAIDAGFVRTERFDADVETEGELTLGMLVADRRKANAPSVLPGRIKGCVEVSAERFVAFFLDRVLSA